MTAHMIGVVGVPGSGKSHFARSAADLGKTAVALPDPKEASFYGADAKVFADLDWRPHLNEFKATGILDLLRWLDSVGKSDAQYIVVDPFSEVSDLALHEVLKVHATNDPRDVEYGRAYTGHDQQIKTVVTELRRLVVRGKTVVCVFHGKMKELEGAGAAAKQKDMSGKMAWTFEEQLLPAMNSSIRQTIHSAFDLWLYTTPQGYGAGRRWLLTAQADAVRPAKASVKWKPGATPGAIPNDLRSLLAMIEEPVEAAAK